MTLPAWLLARPLADLVRLALDEDGVASDVTSLATVPEEARASAALVAKAAGRIAGLPLLRPESPLMAAFPRLEARALIDEGTDVQAGARVASLRGPARDLLAIERTMLNFLQRLAGIATETARYVAACAGTQARIMETRKTCPGLRALDKHAVLVGGGMNHRMGLSDQVLLKENHLAFCGPPRSAEAVREAIRRVRAARPGLIVEVEAETLAEVEAAIAAKADVVLLDDMTESEMREAVRMRADADSRVLLEVSGGVTLARVAAIARTGIDRISVGALTHSARALDLSLLITTDPGP